MRLSTALTLLLVAVSLTSSTCIHAGILPDLSDKTDLSKLKDAKTDADSKDKTDKTAIASQTKYTGPKKRLAVMDMEVKISSVSSAEPTTSGGVTTTTTVYIPPPTDFGTGLTEMLTTALVDTGRFIVLERKALADIQAEQQLGASGALDPSSAPPVGKLLGAQVLIRGAVTEYTYRKSTTGGSVNVLKGLGLAASKVEAAVVLDIRIYSATTGQVVDSVKAEGRASSSGASIDVDTDEVKMSASGFSQSPLGQATRQAIERAVKFIIERMEEMPWEGRIAEMDTDESGSVATIYINAGSSTGFKVGDEFEIYRPGREIIDPETKVVIGRTKDKLLGRCRIDSLTKDISLALPVEGEGFQIGDIVRFIAPKKPEGPSAKPDQNAQ
jgi:curli biogenesis system outer membrane secretion channel CsgG